MFSNRLEFHTVKMDFERKGMQKGCFVKKCERMKIFKMRKRIEVNAWQLLPKPDNQGKGENYE